MNAASTAAILLNLLALAGAFAFVLVSANSRRRSPVDVRLSALLISLVTLLAVRTLRWVFQIDALGRIEDALAALTPLLALILAEGLLRRHAPRRLKQALLFGTMALATLALLRPTMADPVFVPLLGALVAGGLLATWWLMGTRDRGTLSATENATINMLGVALALALPFATTDFLFAAGHAPLKLGGLGVLVFVYAVVRLSSGGGGSRLVIIADYIVAAASAALGLALLTAMFGAPKALDAAAVFAVLLGFILFLLILQTLYERSGRSERQAMLAALANAPAGPLDAFVDAVLAAPALRSATVVDADDLREFEPESLARALAAHPVAAHAEAKTWGAPAEPLCALLEERQATHAVLLSPAPLSILLVNAPEFGASPDSALHLHVLHKLARAAGSATP